MPAVPFVVGQWVRGEAFYDRAEPIAEILDGPRDSLWLLGARRIGKTSLLKQLERLAARSPERGYFPLFWDFQGAEDEAGLHQELCDALLDAEERLAGIGLTVEELEGDGLFDALGRLRRRLRAKSLRLLLLCDEVEELIALSERNPALLRKLRRILQSRGDVRSVLASTVRLWALADRREDTSPFLHGFAPPLYLGTLPDAAARDLIRQSQLPPEARPAFDDDAVEALRVRCDNHPYLIQLLAKRYLDSGDLEEAVEQVATDRTVSYFFAVDFELLSAAERRILLTISRRSAASSGSLRESLALGGDELSGGLLRLEGLGFVRRDAERRFVLANYFFRRWLRDVRAAGSSLGDFDLTPLAAGAGPEVIAGRYELLRLVGEGASGRVFKAYDRLLETTIAVKLLRPEYAEHEEVLARFRKEIVLSRDIGHPNVLRVYHLGDGDGRKYLTMQWVDGPTLAQMIAAEAPLPTADVAAIGAKLASALAAMHGHKVLHRDLKPQNVLMHQGREPLLTDFGLARVVGETGITASGAFLGTPNYVSPEQAAMGPVDERSDLYSLGVVLFEMATGRRPFEAATVAEVLELHRRAPPPDPREIASGIPDDLTAVILRCLEKGPERRFADAAALRAALEEVAERAAADAMRRVTAIVSALGQSEAAEAPGRPSPEELLPVVYDELRRMARGFLARERPDHTLQPTALVHEAYLRLVDQSRVDWRGRSHFLAVGAQAMRRLLIDHARGRRREKRGGGRQQVTLSEAVAPASGPTLDLDELLAVDEVLEKLRAVDERQARIVELRVFAGLTVAEVAAHLGVSPRTVEADWARARDWLRAELSPPREL